MVSALPMFNLAMRWLLTLAVAGVAVGVPNFARVTGFIGSAFSFSVSVCKLKDVITSMGFIHQRSAM
jgi:hypothetical protein